MAVKIQFSSPIGVRRSFGLPGILSIDSEFMPETIVWVQNLTLVRKTSRKNENYHFNAILMGVVRQAVNISEGRSGEVGKTSFTPQAPKSICSFPILIEDKPWSCNYKVSHKKG